MCSKLTCNYWSQLRRLGSSKPYMLKTNTFSNPFHWKYLVYFSLPHTTSSSITSNASPPTSHRGLHISNFRWQHWKLAELIKNVQIAIWASFSFMHRHFSCFSATLSCKSLTNCEYLGCLWKNVWTTNSNNNTKTFLCLKVLIYLETVGIHGLMISYVHT